MTKSELENSRKALRGLADPARAKLGLRFFKAGPGGYAEGDKFLGVSVPKIRLVAKQFSQLNIKEVDKLLHSDWHEERMLALFILVGQFKKAKTEAMARRLYTFYLTHTRYVNNWDLVDCSARDIVGTYLYANPKQAGMLDILASSHHLWNRRIAIVATHHFIDKGDPYPTMRLAEKLLDDRHDLIQKAAGWMLREMGKKVDRAILTSFLNRHAHKMPRTMLRYAVEHYDEPSRKSFMAQTR